MTKSVRNALDHFHAANRLLPAQASHPVWLATLGTMIIPLPNFQWRREIIDIHDAHHLITGHTTSVEGELCLASWELGLNCYSHWAARLLCGFLMGLGMFWCPRAALAAFRKGQRDRSKYDSIKSEILEMDIVEAQSLFSKNFTDSSRFE